MWEAPDNQEHTGIRLPEKHCRSKTDCKTKTFFSSCKKIFRTILFLFLIAQSIRKFNDYL
jgi:hypothetical protein